MNLLLAVLQRSIEKHGEATPLTLGHLYNLIKLTETIRAKRELQTETAHDKLVEELCYFGQD